MDFEEHLGKILGRNYQIVILDRIRSELGRIGRTRSSKNSGHAMAALELIENRKYQIVETLDGPSDVDSSLIAYALVSRNDVAVATVDREIRSALELQHVPIITPRARQGLTYSKPSTVRSLNKRPVHPSVKKHKE
jgi:rRNA-processing protein FCF1